MALAKLARVAKQTQTKVFNISLATIIGLSSLFSTVPFLFSQSAMAAPTPNVVYNAIPSTLPPNVASVGFEANQTAEFGDYIHLAGTDRALQTVTVTMSDWALAATPNNVTFCSANPSNCTPDGFNYLITLNIYNAVPGSPLNTRGTLIATQPQTFNIPWRPVADPTCLGGTAWRAGDGNCYNGLAFNITFDLSSLNATLPNDVIVGVAFNTQVWGASPVGIDGPYDSLNVGVEGSATVGTDDNIDRVFWNTQTAANYTDHGAGGVGIFREDTAWGVPATPIAEGTIPIQITAVPSLVADTNGNQTTTLSNAVTQSGSNGNGGTVTVEIPQGAVVTGDSSWDGTISPPTISSTTLPSVSGFTLTPTSVIEIGSSSVDLTFNSAVRILFPGAANNLVGFIPVGGAFTPITTVCNGDTQSQANSQLLPAGGACYINAANGTDLVVWTTHFTQFVTYTKTVTPAAQTTKGNTYVVQAGDTMSAIAGKFGLTLSQLEGLNPQAGHPAGNFDLILPGDVLNVGGAVVTTKAAAAGTVPGPSSAGQTSSTSTTSGTSPLSGNGSVKAAEVGTTGAKATGLKWYWWLTIAAVIVLAAGGYGLYAKKFTLKRDK